MAISRIPRRLFGSSFGPVHLGRYSTLTCPPQSHFYAQASSFFSAPSSLSTSTTGPGSRHFNPVGPLSRNFASESSSGSSKGVGEEPRDKPRLVTHVSETFPPGKYRGRGLPNPVGQPDDLPEIEFGKPTGMYGFVRHQHGDPRGHLQEDGRFKDKYSTDSFHWYDAYTDVPKQNRVIVNGELMIKGVETRPMEELFGVEQTNVPFYHRRRLNLWGNHSSMLKAEFCFFWIPTFIIFSLAIPCYTMLYMMDEAVYTTMTVKVIGHQWYWVYEVESPAE